MPRYIDADKIFYTEFPNTSEGLAFRSLIDKMPPVDAEPVVRCKDCIHFRKVGEDVYYCSGECLDMPEPENYCCFGERKEDADK